MTHSLKRYPRGWGSDEQGPGIVWRLSWVVWRLAWIVWRLAWIVWRLAWIVWRLAWKLLRLTWWVVNWVQSNSIRVENPVHRIGVEWETNRINHYMMQRIWTVRASLYFIAVSKTRCRVRTAGFLENDSLDTHDMNGIYRFWLESTTFLWCEVRFWTEGAGHSSYTLLAEGFTYRWREERSRNREDGWFDSASA